MKYCLNSRQEGQYLAKADEIKVAARDHKSIPSLAEKYPNADIVLAMEPNGKEIDQKLLIEYNIACKQKFIVCTVKLDQDTLRFFKDNNIRYYWGYEINTPKELESLKAFTNVCYVRVSGPLFFQQDLLAKVGIPVRATANVADFGYLPQLDGVNGTWIRPEDVPVYERTTAVIEFDGLERLEQERALYRIYAEQKNWPGALDMIITNLGVQKAPTNRMLPPELAQARLNCGQKCAAGSACRICYRYFSLADPDKLAPYAKKSD